MDKAKRQIAANKLKAAFNLLWDKAIEINFKNGQKNTVSYRDIVRIADAIRADGTKILGLGSLPKQIDASLDFACAALDPNKARAQESIKHGLGGLGGAGGLALAYICLGQLLNPGIWATVVAFFVGGIPGGPLPVVGIAAGLLIAAGAVYASFQRMSLEERSTKAHDYVMSGIDNWVDYGSKDVVLSYEAAQETIKQSASEHGLYYQDFLAFDSLMMNVANADGIFSDSERSAIDLLLGGKQLNKRLNRTEAIETIKHLGHSKASKAMDWCFQVAHADGVFHSGEIELLKRYCQELNVDFDARAKLYGLRITP